MRIFSSLGIVFSLLITTSQLAQSQVRQFSYQFDHNFNRIEIPFTNHNNLIVIPLTLNDKITLQFIVDTGVQTTILTEKTYGDYLGLNYDRRIEVSGPGSNESISALVANDVLVTIPGLGSKNQTLLVLEEDYLNLSSNLGFEVNGIIGYELFSRFVVDINYDEKILILHEPEKFKARKHHTAINIQILNSKPYLNAQILQYNGTILDAMLMVDTGASHPLLLQLLEESAVVLPPKILPAFLGKGLGGEIPGYLGRVIKLKIGPYTFDNVIASYPEEDAYNRVEANGRIGTLGGEILTRFNPIFDYFNNTLYLRKSRKYGKPFQHDMSGMEFIAFGKQLDKILVTNVTVGSPAFEAGVMVGDQILYLNGFKMTASNFRFVNKLLRTKPGRKIKMEVARTDERIKIKFRLREMI
jgi:hypothetical protein